METVKLSTVENPVSENVSDSMKERAKQFRRIAADIEAGKITAVAICTASEGEIYTDYCIDRGMYTLLGALSVCHGRLTTAINNDHD